MPQFDANLLLDKLAAYMAANAAGGALAYSGTPRAVWQVQAVEASATDPFTALIPYGGSLEWVASAKQQIQCKTTGTTNAATRARAQALFASLCDSQGQPRRMIDLGSGVRMLGVNLSTPQPIGLDEKSRLMVVFNIDLTVAQVS